MGLYESPLHQRSPISVNIHQLNSLSTCLLNIKSLLAVYSQTLPLSGNSPLIYWVHYGYAVLIAFKLSLMPAEGWNPILARQELDFDNTLQAHASELEGLARLNPSSTETDIFGRFARQIRRIRLELFPETNENTVSSFSTPCLADFWCLIKFRAQYRLYLGLCRQSMLISTWILIILMNASWKDSIFPKRFY